MGDMNVNVIYESIDELVGEWKLPGRNEHGDR